MATLTPSDPHECALAFSPTSGPATFIVDPTGASTLKVELWERIVPFGAAPPLLPFAQTGTFASTTSVPRTIPIGDMLQVRLYREGQGHASGVGDILGKLDFPCVQPRDGRINFLTRCADMPQLDITPGGTFVSMAFAASKAVRARVQIGTKPPSLDPSGLPAFAAGDVVASVVADARKLLHKVSLIDELLAPDITAHPALRPGQTLFFVILAWDANGAWDFVWNPKGIAPTAPPVSINTKDRNVRVALTRLMCQDDTDDLSAGEAAFKFVVRSDGPEKTKSVTWSDMDTGDSLPVTTALVTITPPNANGAVSVSVLGTEDDSGSVPSDDDDSAATDALSPDGFVPIPFPVGEIAEEVNDAILSLSSHPTGGDDTLRFTAEVGYSVHYV